MNQQSNEKQTKNSFFKRIQNKLEDGDSLNSLGTYG